MSTDEFDAVDMNALQDHLRKLMKSGAIDDYDASDNGRSDVDGISVRIWFNRDRFDS